MLSRLVIAIAVSRVVAASASTPDSVPITTDPVWESGDSTGTFSVALGDVDRDGDLDLVCANSPRDENTLYLNNGGVFSRNPNWITSDRSDTRGIALGDLDGDGDLELVCATYGGQNTVHENENGGFLSSPVWESKSTFRTYEVALGDIDDDGDLDLVCGNLLGSDTLYRNDDGRLTDQPVWESDRTTSTFDVVLGDVDGDGDLDLVTASARIRLYRNDDGKLTPEPVWISSLPEVPTDALALGDVDGDGDLDLACGNTLTGNTLYRNDGGMFTADPIWTSASVNQTRAVALGDVDSDGDLDLACGNDGQSDTIYLNEAGEFTLEPCWRSSRTGRTYSVAFADLEGDGDLDLVCGNFGEANTVYRNTLDETFSASAAWTSATTNLTRDIALGDFDGDGDLDLACANSFASNTVYLNDEGVLSDMPVWSSAPAEETRCVAWGDLDGDGDLDLVCGNTPRDNAVYYNDAGTLNTAPVSLLDGSPTFDVALADVDGDRDLDLVFGNLAAKNTLYRNDAGTFVLAWTSIPSNNTTAVALGDVDGDLDLDLVCGNRGGPSALYRNEGETFTPHPIYLPRDETHAVALGDVDGDGALDLVCGNFGRRNKVYRNEGGTFSSTPLWVSEPSEATLDVALRDVDNDGDLDLVCGNRSEPSTLYLNEGGELATTPVWLSPEAGTYAVALGDLDRDGDADLVLGNAGTAPGESNTVYSGLARPLFRGDPTAPAHQLPNNPAFLRRAFFERSWPNGLQIRFEAVDVESDPIWIAPQVQFEGATVWSPLEVSPGRHLAGPFESSPEGFPHDLELDVSGLPLDPRNGVVRLQSISNPSRVGIVRHVDSHPLEVERLLPLRSAISASVDSLVFPSVTLGDTVSASFTVFNTGTDTLRVTGVSPPSSEMRLANEAPVLVGPQRKTELTMLLEPREDVDVTGELQVLSDDPLRPAVPIRVVTDILELDVTTRALTGPLEVPVGTFFTIEVTPADGVNIERGAVHHRPGGSGGTPSSTELLRSGEVFLGVIQGDAVAETGVEYYVELENSNVFDWDPPGAPMDGTYFQVVGSPDTMTTAVVSASGSDLLEGQGVTVQVLLPDGSLFSSGMLYHRAGGRSEYDSVAITASGLLPEATIPGTSVTARGVEYWVKVHTATADLTDPAAEPPGSKWLPVPVTVANLQEPSSHAGGRYRALSVPLEFGVNTQTIEPILSDHFGLYDPKRWQVWRYLTEERNYVGIAGGPSEHLRPEPGRAFWVISRETHRIDTAPLRGVSTATDRPSEVALPSGWTMLGNPFSFAVPWDSVRAGAVPAPENSLLTGPIRWDEEQNAYDYDPASILEPFDGYWVHNAGEEATLFIPPVEVEATSPGRATESPGFDWRIRLFAESSSGARTEAFVGVHAEGRTGHDRHDRFAPPPTPGSWVLFGVVHPDWGGRAGLYGQDARAPDPDGHRFDLLVRSGSVEEIRLRASSDLPASFALRLVDREQDQSVDLLGAEEHRLVSFGPDDDYRLTLLVGTEDYLSGEGNGLVSLPLSVVLEQNSPNPFRSATRIRFGLPADGPADLAIFDVRGARVASLWSAPLRAGYHTLVWNGRDDRGRRVGSGVYFYRMRTRNETLTRKLMFLR